VHFTVRPVQSLSACTTVQFTVRPVQRLSACTRVHFTVRPVQGLSASTRVHFTICFYHNFGITSVTADKVAVFDLIILRYFGKDLNYFFEIYYCARFYCGMYTEVYSLL
jgi:hypothetical protein